MADDETVSVALTSEQVADLRAAVAAGEYATTSDIVQEAVRDWQHKRALLQGDAARLRDLWDAGIASGPAGPVSFQDVRREARGRLDEATKAAGDAD